MSEYVSTSQRPQVFMAIPTRGTVRIEWAMMMQQLGGPANATWLTRVFPNQGVVEARNSAVEACLKHNAELLFFLDDDTLVPNQALRRLLFNMAQHPEWDVISGIVTLKNPEAEPCIFRGDTPGPYWGWTFNEQFEIDACGMACCLIRSSIFEKVGEPWFTWNKESDGASFLSEEGEDIQFCRRVKEAGGTIVADGGLLCGHIADDGKVHCIRQDSGPIQRGAEALKNDGYKVLDPA